MNEIFALLQKETSVELRSRAGFLTAVMFSLVTVVALGLASMDEQVSGMMGAGVIMVALLFASVVSLPRSFISEEEQGTGDLLRLWTTAKTVFWAKAIYNLIFMAGIGLVTGIAYVALAHLNVTNWLQFLLCVLGVCISLSGTVTLCGALVSQASHRSLLAGAIALPLLLPLVFLGIAAMKAGLGDASAHAWSAIGGLWCYAAASLLLGPILFEAIWKP